VVFHVRFNSCSRATTRVASLRQPVRPRGGVGTPKGSGKRHTFDGMLPSGSWRTTQQRPCSRIHRPRCPWTNKFNVSSPDCRPKRLCDRARAATLMRQLSSPAATLAAFRSFTVRSRKDVDDFDGTTVKELESESVNPRSATFTFSSTKCHRTQKPAVLQRLMKGNDAQRDFIGFTGTPLLRKGQTQTSK